MSETLMALMKKGGGSEDIIGENKMLKFLGNRICEIVSYNLNEDIIADLTASYVTGMVFVNCEGHTTANIDTQGGYDTVIGISENEATQIALGGNRHLTDYDISSFKYLVFFWNSGTTQTRHLTITN